MGTQQNAIGGICDHSSDAHWKPYIIFCVGQDPAERIAFELFCWASDINFKRLIGAYEDYPLEHSYIVESRHFKTLRNDGWLDGEESILLLDKPEKTRRSLRKATLLYLNTFDRPSEDIGYFQSIREDDLLKGVIQGVYDGWTYDPSTNTYFTCAPKGIPQS